MFLFKIWYTYLDQQRLSFLFKGATDHFPHSSIYNQQRPVQSHMPHGFACHLNLQLHAVKQGRTEKLKGGGETEGGRMLIKKKWSLFVKSLPKCPKRGGQEPSPPPLCTSLLGHPNGIFLHKIFTIFCLPFLASDLRLCFQFVVRKRPVHYNLLQTVLYIWTYTRYVLNTFP